MARVWVVEGGATFTNALGEFRLSVRGVRGDTITVVAGNGYDGGMYAETRSGSARIVLHESVVEADVVLDRVDPI
jgi:hypothetical protein